MKTNRMALAYGVWVAQRIIDADGVVSYGEMSLYGQLFSRMQLMDYGFLEHEGNFTEAFLQALEEAREKLPKTLSFQEKLDLLSILHGTAMADGELAPSELAVLNEAADELLVPKQAWLAYLAEQQE